MVCRTLVSQLATSLWLIYADMREIRALPGPDIPQVSICGEGLDPGFDVRETI